MTIKVRDAGTLRTITSMKVRQAGITRTIRTAKVYDGSTLRTVAIFADPLSVTSPGGTVTGNSSTLTTENVTATPSGGFAPYTYSWALTTNGGGTASTTSASTSATTTFTKTNLTPEADVTDEWTVTVTDALGSTAQAVVPVTFFYLTGI